MKKTSVMFRDDQAAQRTMATVLSSSKQVKELCEILSGNTRNASLVKSHQSNFSYNYNANFVKLCAIIYKVNSELPEPVKFYLESLVNISASLVGKGTIETFKNLYPEAQKRFLEMGGLDNQVHALAWLRTVDLMGAIPSDDFVLNSVQNRSFLPQSVPDFTDRLKVAAEETKHSPRELDFSPFSESFQKLLADPNMILSAMRTHKGKFLIYWRAIFGEEAVISLFQNFAQEKIYINAVEALYLLEHWEEFKAYPASWIKETALSEFREKMRESKSSLHKTK